jgi:hypothetical protein
MLFHFEVPDGVVQDGDLLEAVLFGEGGKVLLVRA